MATLSEPKSIPTPVLSLSPTSPQTSCYTINSPRGHTVCSLQWIVYILHNSCKKSKLIFCYHSNYYLRHDDVILRSCGDVMMMISWWCHTEVLWWCNDDAIMIYIYWSWINAVFEGTRQRKYLEVASTTQYSNYIEWFTSPSSANTTSKT